MAVPCWHGPPCQLPTRQDPGTAICPIPLQESWCLPGLLADGMGQSRGTLQQPDVLWAESVMGLSDWQHWLGSISDKRTRKWPQLWPQQQQMQNMPWPPAGVSGWFEGGKDSSAMAQDGRALQPSLHSEKGHEVSASQQKCMDLCQRS